MAKFKNSKMAWWKIALIVLACVLVVGALAGLITSFAIKNADEQDGKLPTSAYSVGGLNEDGSYLDTKESIYTKNLFKSADLKCSLVFDHNISYRVFFYDANEDFVSATGVLTGDYSTVPNYSPYCRIVITPDEDQNIKWYEVKGYAKQLTVEYNENAKVEKLQKVVLTYEDNNKVFADFELKVNEDKSAKEQYKTSKPVNLSGYTKIRVFDKKPFCVYFGDKDSKNIGDQYKIYMGAEVYEIDIPVGAVYVRFAAPFVPVDNQIENAIIYLVK